MSSEAPQGWPPGVEPIGVENLARLGLDEGNRLFWDGRQVEMRRVLTLTRMQKSVAAVVTTFAVLGGLGGFLSGINNASLFLCARGIAWLSCPPAPH